MSYFFSSSVARLLQSGAPHPCSVASRGDLAAVNIRIHKLLSLTILPIKGEGGEGSNIRFSYMPSGIVRSIKKI